MLRVFAVSLGGLLLSGCAIQIAPGDLTIDFKIGLSVVLLANVLYLKWRLEDEPSAIKRTVAFLTGLPTTFLLWLMVEPSTSWMNRRQVEHQALHADDDLHSIEEDFAYEQRRMRRLLHETAEPSSMDELTP